MFQQQSALLHYSESIRRIKLLGSTNIPIPLCVYPRLKFCFIRRNSAQCGTAVA